MSKNTRAIHDVAISEPDLPPCRILDKRAKTISARAGRTASDAQVPRQNEYIRNQEQHHQKESYQDEFRRLLTKYEIDFDERYVWD